MLVMSKKKEQPEEEADVAPRYPSRETYTSVTIPKKLAAQLRPIAKKMDRSLSYIVRKACEAYLQSHSNEQ